MQSIQNQFADVAQLIRQARSKAIKAVNTRLIDLYWNIGEYISRRVDSAEWGQSVVSDLARYLQLKEPGVRGFSDKNLWRMKQFYEAYKAYPNLSSLMREISWTHNLAIMGRTKSIEEKEFYLNLCKREKFSVKELERQIGSGVFERTVMGNAKLSSAMREIYPEALNTFRDSYIFDFLNLEGSHKEGELQKGLIARMKDFIMELGKDFLFFGQEYKLQVGSSDFYIDLLFYHRGLQCLIAIELKTGKFRPGHLGQLNFYLEALDRNVKKPHENPSIGILLCKDKDNEVVEYSLSRSLSPTMVAQYQTQLPDKKMLQLKMNEIYNDKGIGPK